ncbi:MAG: hypothetical protein IJA80_00845 [Clostridia bacterium]|nr:hypothetical protein [Clostridia bacterium]
MDKIEKRMAMRLNIAFSICYIYFISFYSIGLWQNDAIELKPSSGVLIDVLSKVMSFLFQSESGMIPLAVISLSLIIISVFGFSLHGMHLSKVTTGLLCLGFVPTLAPILCNMIFGPITDDKSSDMLWLSVTILLIIYLVIFQILFYKDYKKIK